MVLAKKELSVEEYSAFAEEYHQARYKMHYKVHMPLYGPLAQSVERRADNAKAVSSSLTWTMGKFFFLFPSLSCHPLT